MRVVILDPVHIGHHFPYVAGVTRAVVELPGVSPIVVVSVYSQDRQEYKQHIAPLAGLAEVRAELPRVRYGKLDLIRSTREMFALVRERYRPDAILMPSGDPFTQIASTLAWMGSRPAPRSMHLECCIHRCAFAYPRESVPRVAPDPIALRTLSHGVWNTIHVVDHMALERIHATPGKLGARLRDRCALMPDPVDAPTVTRMADARRALCVPPDGRLIACTGMLDERKGVDLLVRAFARACQNNQLRADDRLLLAGLASARVRGILGGACAGLVRDGRIIVMDRFLSDEELALALAAPDVVCTPHPSHVGISSIALRALAAGRCVLASDFGWQGWFVERFGLGIACGVRSEEEFAASIGAALDAATDFTRTPTHDALLRFHSPENFRACWTRALRARMGLPVPPGLVSWEETVAACANQESHA